MICLKIWTWTLFSTFKYFYNRIDLAITLKLFIFYVFINIQHLDVACIPSLLTVSFAFTCTWIYIASFSTKDYFACSSIELAVLLQEATMVLIRMLCARLNCVQVAFAVLISWMIFRNPISVMNAVGCAITLVGCTFYGYVRHLLSQQPPPPGTPRTPKTPRNRMELLPLVNDKLDDKV